MEMGDVGGGWEGEGNGKGKERGGKGREVLRFCFKGVKSWFEL